MYLKTGSRGSEPVIACASGALKSGACSALTDFAKQKEVIVSKAKARRASRISEDCPARLRAVRMLHSVSIYAYSFV